MFQLIHRSPYARIATAFFTGLFTILTGLSANAQIGNSVDIRPENLRFEFGSQDGDFVIPCQHKVSNPMTRDWEITCADPEKPSSKRTYTLHLVVKTYLRATAPKMTYEILHWLTDHQIKPGDVGRYVGSTVRFRLKEPSEMHSLDLGQDIENTNVLRMELSLPK